MSTCHGALGSSGNRRTPESRIRPIEQATRVTSAIDLARLLDERIGQLEAERRAPCAALSVSAPGLVVGGGGTGCRARRARGRRCRAPGAPRDGRCRAASGASEKSAPAAVAFSCAAEERDLAAPLRRRRPARARWRPTRASTFGASSSTAASARGRSVDGAHGQRQPERGGGLGGVGDAATPCPARQPTRMPS